MSPEKPFQKANRTRQEFARALKGKQEYHTKISPDEASFLLRLPKNVLATHFSALIVYTDDHQIALIHGSSRDIAMEGLKNWAEDENGKNRQTFASFAYDRLYKIIQGCRHEQGTEVIKGQNGLMLDALAQLPSFGNLKGFKEYLAGGGFLTDIDYEMLLGRLHSLWDSMGSGNNEDKGGRRPENVFR